MNILLIFGAYKPYMSANGVCCDNVIAELIRRGHSVTALVNAVPTQPKREIKGNLTIERVAPRLSVRLGDLAKRSGISQVRSKLLTFASSLVNNAQLFLMSPLWPSVAPSATKRFSRAAIRLDQIHQFDAVISVYTPAETLLAGCALKQFRKDIVFISYFLDALAGGWGPKRWGKSRIGQHTRKLETYIARYADLLVSMESSRTYHEANPICEYNADNQRHYMNVPLLVPLDVEKTNTESQSNVANAKPHRVRLLFAGYIDYPRRDPIPLLEILKRVCSQMDAKAVFIGTCTKPELFTDYREESGGRIEYIGQLNHDNLIHELRIATAFLNIGSANPNAVSGKIFEYMAYRKPIISTYSIDNEPCVPYLKRYNSCFFIDQRGCDYDAVAQKLVEYLSDERAMRTSECDIEQVFYANTPGAFVDLLTDVVDSRCIHDE